jgi:hypothetical protein
MKKSFIYLSLFLVFAFLQWGCSSSDGDGSSGNNSSGNNRAWGEMIPIPGISPNVEGDFALDLKASNEGMYMRVSRSSSPNLWVYRMQNSGVPTWIMHEEPSIYYSFRPTSAVAEGVDQFSIFFTTNNKNGYVNINTGLPALLEESHPAGFDALGVMLVDNSANARKWAFFGNTVKIKEPTNVGNYSTICTLPTGVSFAEADPYESIVWAASGSKVYKITASGSVTTFDVNSYNDPTQMTTSVAKIRFSYDPIHRDVYFRYQNKVFKIADGNSLGLFYTINNGANWLGGDFCVDNTFMYATDGTKKHLQLLNESNIIPPQPVTSNTNLLLAYLQNTSAFGVGPIEVSTNPLDQYIYAISNAKVLKVPKS